MPRRQVREPAFAVIFVLLTSFCVTHAHADSTSLGECGEPATLISTIQGTENASKSAERGTVVVEGVVVGDFQQTSFNGFYVEEEDAQQDSNPNTSEGIFVFKGANAAPVAAGDVVRVMGTVFEFEELTELTGPVQLKVCPQKAQVTPKVLKLPISDPAVLESYEGMLVTIDQPLTVTGNYELARYGTLELSVGGRLMQPTQLARKGEPANQQQHANDARKITLDDGDGRQSPKPVPYKSEANTRRLGDTLPSLTGIFDQHFGTYRIQPIGEVKFQVENPRPYAPESSAHLRVASVNVLNYFTTLDDRRPHCGPKGTLDCRGANNDNEFQRQRAKLLTALVQLDPDVLGLLEIENAASAPVADIVAGLNSALGEGTYAYVDTGTLGTDAIMVALVYKPGRVALQGKFALLDTSVDKSFSDTKNRPVLAQSFDEKATNARFTVALNHWKSKGSDCEDVGDKDLKDGQGNCNKTRTDAANALVGWLKSDPTKSEDPDFLVIGDLNSYAKEDPILALEAGGFKSLIAAMLGETAYSFQFDSQSGYLDHAFASPSLVPQVAGVVEWHINADEPSAVDYNLEVRTDDLYRSDEPFRMSDHDPLLVVLNLAPVPVGAKQLALWVGLPGVAVALLALRFLRLRRARAAAPKP
ncbi:MAG TPA: ExeM/NucH family extracellular endonuclease [Polyangiales bacterium]|nr:ExeM/NucH family extracellular endonuclease [Polyangiales bacterium]